MIWSLALIIGQVQAPEGRPEDVAKLKPSELVRMYRYGGKTRTGVFHRLLIIGKDFTVTVKDQQGTRRSKLTLAERNDLKGMLNRATWRALTAQKRNETYAPSAADGIDIYVNFRDGKAIRTWSNVKWQRPDSSPFLEALEKHAT